jgi:ribosome-binding ATPase YchF (GTP1/OBG family)
MKDIGIVGAPYSGKTTLFTALTRAGSVGGRANQAVVDVPDDRLSILQSIEKSQRVVHAKVRFVDVPGGLTAQGIGEYRQTDALCIVLRAFGGETSPSAELSEIGAELILADLASVESGLEKTRKKAKGQADARSEVELLERALASLEAERPLRDELSEDEAIGLKGFGLLTLKPWIVVANVDEGAGIPSGLPAEALAISAALEAEVASVEESDAAELLAGFGVKESGLALVIGACFRALDLITFLTTGEDETRAWEVRRGAKAPEAAGVIHSDLERGFIRAEVVGYEDLVAAGSWDQAKLEGLLRVEGKEYVVQEGDVLHVRFAV